jgi:hypothetical protein
MRDYGHILTSTETRIVRAVVMDGLVHVQQFTTWTEIVLDLAAAEDLVMLAEAAQDEPPTGRDAYLGKLLRREAEMPPPATVIPLRPQAEPKEDW